MQAARAQTDETATANTSQWECQPSKDFRSWVCLKDGKKPVEPVPEPLAQTPEPAAKTTADALADTTAAPAEGVTITPLAPPDHIEPIKPAAPAEALAESSEPAPESTAMPSDPAAPAVAEAPAATPDRITDRPAGPAAEAAMAEQQQAAQSVATDADEMPAPAETAAEPVMEPVVAEEKSAADAEATPQAVAETTQPSAAYQPDLELVRIDNSLPSCVAVNRPSSLSGSELLQQREASATQIEADDVTIEKDKLTVLTGNVEISRADQQLKADRVELNKETNESKASGNVVYTDNVVQLQASQAHLDMDADENTFDDARFTTLGRYSRGSASQIRSSKGEILNLDKVQYTSCAPGIDSWLLTADEIELNDVTGRGTAKNAKLEFFDIPVFYSPKLYFPIDDRRQSGVLNPRIANSSTRGFSVTVPFYWNIAPDKDATFYPRYMNDRGLQLGGEFRYLNETNRGQVNLDYLANDDKFNNRDRWAFNYRHAASYFNDWNFETQVNRVSDDQYFEDLGTSLTLTSQRFLQSFLKINKTSDNWSFYGLLQDYQTVDRSIAAANRPYERLPSLNFNAWTDTFGGGFEARIDAQYTDFDRDNSITGKRTSIYPSISYTHETAGYYIKPKLGVHYTKYSLRNAGTLPTSPTRSVPIFSIDSGLFYERNTSLFGKSVLQTLEPRIYYLNVAERKQTNIPVFDTSLFDFNASSLFRENRYSGQDRIGDTNQVSVGITSRFLDNDSGAELLGLTFGQIYYFSDRDVSLPGNRPDDDSSSPIIAELRYRPYQKLVASALMHWDPETGSTERAVYRLKYQPTDNRIINLSYRLREDQFNKNNSLKQTDASFLWPISKDKRWHAVGRWNYSLRHDKTLDTLAGIEYESCCWKTRVVARRWVRDINSDYDTGIFFELELKGLGSIGDDITSFLQTGILGYDRYASDKDDDSYYY